MIIIEWWQRDKFITAYFHTDYFTRSLIGTDRLVFFLDVFRVWLGWIPRIVEFFTSMNKILFFDTSVCRAFKTILKSTKL